MCFVTLIPKKNWPKLKINKDGLITLYKQVDKRENNTY